MLLRILFFLVLLMSSKPTASGNALVGTIISTQEIWGATPSNKRLSSELQRKERRITYRLRVCLVTPKKELLALSL